MVVQNIVPLAVIEVYHFFLRDIHHVYYGAGFGGQAAAGLNCAPYGKLRIIGLRHELCSLAGEPVIAVEIVLCHVSEVELYIYALVKYPAAVLKHQQRLVVLPGVKANGIPCHTLDLRALFCLHYSTSAGAEL